ncbi:MAG: FhaA domain-containing protein [Acidimicrobiales bacterium]
MGIKGFERSLENMVEGAFARVFRSGLRPIELGRRLVREMDDNRSVDVRGRTIVPNAFAITVSQDDNDRFAEIGDSLTRELCDAAREHAHDEAYVFMGPVTVDIEPSNSEHPGTFTIVGRMKEGPGGVGAGSLVLSNGTRVTLGDRAVTIGRMPECDLILTDTNVSRRHAEIRPTPDGFALVDLGSTNGCRVNGVLVTQRDLRDGDELTFGNTRIVFQAS